MRFTSLYSYEPDYYHRADSWKHMRYLFLQHYRGRSGRPGFTRIYYCVPVHDAKRRNTGCNSRCCNCHGRFLVVASPIVKMSGAKSLEDAQKKKDSMKAEAKGIAGADTVSGADVSAADIKKIIFACDAGMGSSAMGATKFRNRIKSLNLGITVTNTSVDNVPGDADVVVCQHILKERAAKSAPQARLVTLDNFLQDPNLDALYGELAERAAGGEAPAAEEVSKEENAENAAEEKKSDVLLKEGIKTGLASVDKETAIRAAGRLLCDLGYVDENYIDAMVAREELVTTYMGMGVAIPHGTSDAKETVKKTVSLLCSIRKG
jgi:PTS system mannitol-specific IIC component